MTERVQPKTWKEFVEFCQSFPRGRRITGYVATISFLIFLLALIAAAYFRTGFLSYLVLAFFLFVSSMHSNYALAVNLTPQKVRRIDYWYVGAAAVGLLLFALSYTNQRDAAIGKLYLASHRSAEEPIRQKVISQVADLTAWLCGTERARTFRPTCEGIRKFAPQITANLPAEKIDALKETFSNTVTMVYARMFTRDQLTDIPNLFSPFSIVMIRLEAWADHMRSAPPESVTARDADAELLFNLGQLVVWPFFLAYALALRLTKVTVDVFEWTK